MKLIRWSVDNPFAVIALYLGLFIAAAMAMNGYIPTRMMPYIESPMIGIITQAPGMSAEDVETYISKPIEERMVDISGVRFIRSSSTQGTSIVSLEFEYRYNMKKALADVQNLMSAAQADLPYDPANLKPPRILPIDPLNLPVLKVALSAPQWDPIKLREFADNTLVTRLKRANNVESVFAFGGYKRQAQVVVDRDRLAAYGLSILDLRKAVDGANVDRSAGTLTWMETEMIVRLAGRATSGGALSDTVIGSFQGGPVYLRDVAKAEDTYQERRSFYRFNGHEAIELNIIQRPGASSPDTIDSVREEMAKIRKEFPNLQFEEAYDNAHFVNIIKYNMYDELAVGIVLTGIVIFLFLGDWRGTLIALITIPSSLAVAVLLFVPSGLSLNSSTLIGLLLAIGRLVDDSIIDIHSVSRHLALGKSARDAAIDGCTEVRRSVIAATIMICLAMLPLTFTGGLTQVMFEGIVWPFLFCLLASLGVALTLTPLLAAYAYRGYTPGEKPRLLRPWFRFLDGSVEAYGRLLKWALGHRAFVMAVAGVAVYCAFALFPLIGYEMMPLADVGQGYAVMEARPGTSFAQTAEMAKRLEKILLEQPEIKRVSLRVGSEPGGTYFNGYSMGGVNTVNAMLTFSDKEDRRRTIWEVVDAVNLQARSTIPNIRRLAIKEMGADVMASSMAPIELLVYGPDLERLSWLAEKTENIMERDYPDIYQPATAWSLDLQELRVEVDQRRAAELSLTPSQVAEQAYYALNGGLTREFFNPPQVRKSTILIRYEEEQRKGLADLENVIITSPDGTRVPLKTLATISVHRAPSVIQRDGLRRVNSVLGYYRQGGPGSMQLTMDVMMDSLMQLPYPPGYGLEQRGDMTQMMDSFSRLLWGMVLALLFIYLSLVMQFHSLTQPLTMMAAIPLEAVGVMAGLYLAGQAFSTVSILGIIVLNGMDVTASILLVDHILHLRKEGVERDEAVALSGPVRLPPILMTVIVTMVVMTPVALFPKTGMDAYSPLAVVVLGGLGFSTVLTLLAIPVLYTLVDDFEQWLSRMSKRLRKTSKSTSTVLLMLLLLVPLSQPARAQAQAEAQSGPETRTTLESPPPLSSQGLGPAGFPIWEGALKLDDAIQIALQQNLPLRISKAELEISQADVLRAASEGRIKASVGGYLLWSDQPTMWSVAPTITPPLMVAAPGEQAVIMRANLMYPLFTGGLLEARLAAAKASERAAISDVAAVMQVMLFKVRSAYYGVILAQDKVTLAAWNVAEQEEALRLFQVQLKAGRIASYVVYRSQAEVANAQQRYNTSRTALSEARTSLNETLAVSVKSQFLIGEDFPNLTHDSDFDTDIATALSDRPELMSAKYGVDEALHRIEEAEAAYSPQVYLGAQYSTVSRSPLSGNSGGYDGGYSIGMSVAIPLLDGGERKSRVLRGKAMQAGRELRLRQAELQVTGQVADARSRWESASVNFELSDQEVIKANEDLRVARLRQKVGRSIYLETLDALEAVSRARLNQMQTHYDLAIAQAQLQLATGQTGLPMTIP